VSVITLVQTTFAQAEDAERVAAALLDERLIACANILSPCTSVYRWHGAIERAEEVPVLFKTRPMLAQRVRERIAALHPYDLPVIESWDAVVTPDVLAWIERETG
jgi:periplasmic divalent cation tolerance protein